MAPQLDEPGVLKEFGQVDFLVSCGDLPPEYLSRLSHRFNAPLYYVKGNHDIRYAQSPPTGCVNAHARLIKHKNLSILGLEGSHWYNGGPNQYTEQQMRSIVRRLRLRLFFNQGVDIILTHSPPRHIHDKEDQCHMGFEIFRTIMDRYSPRFFLHGHVHVIFKDDAERISLHGETKVINCYNHYLLEFDEQQTA